MRPNPKGVMEANNKLMMKMDRDRNKRQAKSKALEGAKKEFYADKMKREHVKSMQISNSHKTSLSAHNDRNKDIENFRKAFKKQK